MIVQLVLQIKSQKELKKVKDFKLHEMCVEEGQSEKSRNIGKILE